MSTNNWVVIYFLLTLLMFLTIIISYYSYYIYKSFILIKNIEDKHKSKLIYIKDYSTNFIDKILMYIYKNYIISINDNYSLRRILQTNSDKNIIILIRSMGGYISSSDSMLNLLDIHKPTKHAYVPSYAMSAATLLALSCDKIYMNKYAAIGPTDPQISVFDEMISFRTVSKIVETKSADTIKDKLLIAYYENKILYDDNIKIVKKCVNKHKKNNVNEDNINEVVNMFSLGDLPHHSEISFNTLNKFININNTIPEHILKVYALLNYIFQII